MISDVVARQAHDFFDRTCDTPTGNTQMEQFYYLKQKP